MRKPGTGESFTRTILSSKSSILNCSGDLFWSLSFILAVVCSCDKNSGSRETAEPVDAVIATKDDSEIVPEIIEEKLMDSSFVQLSHLSDDFIFDLKYATSDNFLNEKVYDCDDCFLRFEVARSLVRANEKFLEMGYKIKLFDCYRPLSVQKKMWQVMPDARYVANPYTSSSYHNRGCAVDLTLTNLEGNELDMGTPFDFFGEESHFRYPGHSDEVRLNRELLRELLESEGFKGIRTEWWHFSRNKYPVSDEDLCEK